MLKKVLAVFLIFSFLVWPYFSILSFPALAACTTNVEKFTNTGFESDLGSWTSAQTYDLQDQFTTDRTAGAVNGTSAEPTGGARTVTDTNNKLSITGGKASFATGGVGAGNPSLWYGSTTRVGGKAIVGTLNGTNSAYDLGFDNDQASSILDGINFNTGTSLRIITNTSGIVVGSPPASSVDVNVALIARASGMFYFIKETTAFPNWTLLYVSAAGTADLFPAVAARSSTSVFTADNVHIPSTLYIPTPLVSDGFSASTTDGSGHTENNGPVGTAWTGDTWTVSGGSVSNSPTQGSELLTDGGLENWASPTNLTSWTESILGASTVNQETTTIHGGSNAVRLNIDASNSLAEAYQGPSITGTWYQMSLWSRGSDTTPTISFGENSSSRQNNALTASYTQLFTTFRGSGATAGFSFKRGLNSASKSIYIDDISAKSLTTSSLFRSIDAGSADALVEAKVTGPTSTSGVQGGLVLNLDSTSNPQNFIIVYLDGAGNVKVDEAVSGVYTNKASTAVTYGATKVLRAIKYGNSLDVYYDNAKVGSTITGLTANTNTRHGLFSTYSGNTFDDFVVWDRDGYTDAPFEELTSADRDTGVKYAGGASAKLVAGSTDANYLQNVNVGDTASYNLSAYAYTDGSAVTSSDLGLYANGTALSTTYSSVGGGWYKLTGTLSGTASSVGYGVRVKSGKTVYIDNLSLNTDAPALCPASPPECTDTAPASSPAITSTISGTNSVTINFSPASDPVSYYALEYGTSSGNYQYGAANIGGKGTTSYTVQSLSPGVRYYFRVRAGNGCMTGPWSSEKSAVTLGGGYYQPPTEEAVPVPGPTPRATPTPLPTQSPAPVSEGFEFPKISLPRISLPRISISLPQISFPQISLSKLAMPSISLPQISLDVRPILSLVVKPFTFTGRMISSFVAFVKESVDYAGFIASDSYTKQRQFLGRLGDWLVYTRTSFAEIVLDTEPTRITEVQVLESTATSAKIYWRTNHLSTSQVSYGESLDYGQDELSNERVHEHILEIKNLKPNTKYFYEVMSQNKNYVYNANHEFITPGR